MPERKEGLNGQPWRGRPPEPCQLCEALGSFGKGNSQVQGEAGSFPEQELGKAISGGQKRWAQKSWKRWDPQKGIPDPQEGLGKVCNWQCQLQQWLGKATWNLGGSGWQEKEQKKDFGKGPRVLGKGQKA